MEVVQRRSALRGGSGERDIRFGGIAERLDCECLAAVPSGRRDGIQADGDSSVHPHRSAVGSAEFVQALEGAMKRRLAPQRGGALLKPVWMRDRANWPLSQSRWRSMI